MSEVQKAGGFTAPPVHGAAEVPKAGGVVTKKSMTKEATESSKKAVRNIKVVAIGKGWFDTDRMDVGAKFMVSEQEFSDKWMQKI